MISPIYVKMGSPPNRRIRPVMVQDMARRKFSGAGRKRKVCPREPNGQPQRQSMPKVRDDIMGVVKAQRLRVVAEAHVLDPNAEAPLGIYFLRGLINREEKAAGELFARLVTAVKRDYDSPRSDAKLGFLSRLVTDAVHPEAAPPPPLRLAEDLVYSEAELRQRRGERLARYNKAFEALHDAGRPANMAVNRVAIRELHINEEDQASLKRGLRFLALHFEKEGA